MRTVRPYGGQAEREHPARGSPVRNKSDPVRADRGHHPTGLVGVVVVLHARADALPRQVVADLAAGLGPAERERAGRFLSRRARDSYVVAHVLLRHALRWATGGGEPSIRKDRNGRPELASDHGDPPLRFSLSHTDGLAACALARGGPVGIDAEAVVPALACADVAEAYFAGAERELLAACPPESRAETFFRLWTLKEAIGKATGHGLSPALKGFAFSLDPLALSIAGTSDEDAERWRFAEFAPGPAHQMALAVRREGPEPLRVVCEAVDPARLAAWRGPRAIV